MVEIQRSKDTCIDILSTDHGNALELMANLRSTDQILKVLDGYLCRYLGSEFGIGETETLLRASVGWNGKGRDGIEAIGKTPDYANAFQARDIEL